MERVATPKRVTKRRIQQIFAVLPLSSPITGIIILFGLEVRPNVLCCVQKVNLCTSIWRIPDKILPDEMVVKINGQRFWLSGSVDPVTEVIRHLMLYPTGTIVAQ